MSTKPKHVKIYDLKNNLIQEFSTFKEAAIFLNVKVATVKASVYRKTILFKMYKIKSEGEKFIGFKHGKTSGPNYNKLSKSYNKKRCQVRYSDPDLDELSKKRNREISDKIMNLKRSILLTDNYIINSLEKHLGLKPQYVTPELIEIKRKQLTVIRTLKKQRTCLK